jgi:hypothetical protein
MAGTWTAPPPPLPAAPLPAAPLPAAPMPVIASLAAESVKPNPVPRPTIRLQAPDDLAIRRTAFVLPSPQALGIRPPVPAPSAVPPAASSTASAPTLDWNDAHARLQRLGARGFHLTQLQEGSCQALCLLPTSDQRLHQIEAVAGSEAAAVQALLAAAESWVSTQK